MYKNFTYKKISEDDFSKQERLENWNIAKGLQLIDNAKPSEYMKSVMDELIDGKKSYKQVEHDLYNYYKENKIMSDEVIKTKECDIVSLRIMKVLESGAFTFSPITLKSIHRQLFEGLFENELDRYIGNFRDYNIVKDEPILNGDTVIYGDYTMLDELLAYDFNEEKTRNGKISVKSISRFTSAIWQIHPFVEGNTITTAVFIIKYLRSLGYDVNNDLFKEYSLYFRNALVLSNYADIKRNIRPNFRYIEMFFEKLLEDKDIELDKM